MGRIDRDPSADDDQAVTDTKNDLGHGLLGTQDTWSGIRIALKNGARGLPRPITLADFLWEKRGVPNKANRPKLSVEQILKWIDEHKKQQGVWPDQNSGPVQDTVESWRGIDVALNKGGRGLPGRSSIRTLLSDHRGVRNSKHKPALSVSQILKAADAFQARTGQWPKTSMTAELAEGTEDSWASIDAALRLGKRGLRKSSLADLLSRHRGVRNHLKAPHLNLKQILRWADRHKREAGVWPTADTGQITGAKHEKWANVQAALTQGTRGLPGGDSLSRLLERERGARNRLNTPSLTIRQILRWADEHKAQYGDYPIIHDKRGPAPDESWLALNASLERGKRGLPGGSSLPLLLAKERGVSRGVHRPRLKLETIARWARAHHTKAGAWPSEGSGQIAGTDERWDNIAQCVRLGLRGCPSGWTLKKILDKYCRNPAAKSFKAMPVNAGESRL